MAAVGLTATCAVGVAAAIAPGGGPARAPGAAPTAGHRGAPPGTTARPAGVVATPAPVVATAIVIPGIDVASDLVGLGLQADRTVEVPTDPDDAGWFDLGTVPGDTGTAVVLGHVDSTDGPAVFARLGELSRGDRVDVSLSSGRVVGFTVRAHRTYANADFPARKVYGDHGRPQLALVTCGGAYDASRGGYQANVVVYADLADPG